MEGWEPGSKHIINTASQRAIFKCSKYSKISDTDRRTGIVNKIMVKSGIDAKGEPANHFLLDGSEQKAQRSEHKRQHTGGHEKFDENAITQERKRQKMTQERKFRCARCSKRGQKVVDCIANTWAPIPTDWNKTMNQTAYQTRRAARVAMRFAYPRDKELTRKYRRWQGGDTSVAHPARPTKPPKSEEPTNDAAIHQSKTESKKMGRTTKEKARKKEYENIMNKTNEPQRNEEMQNNQNATIRRETKPVKATKMDTEKEKERARKESQRSIYLYRLVKGEKKGSRKRTKQRKGAETKITTGTPKAVQEFANKEPGAWENGNLADHPGKPMIRRLMSRQLLKSGIKILRTEKVNHK